MPTSHKPASPSVSAIRRAFDEKGGFNLFLDRNGRLMNEWIELYIARPLDLSYLLFSDEAVETIRKPETYRLFQSDFIIGRQRYLVVTWDDWVIMPPTPYEELIRV